MSDERDEHPNGTREKETRETRKSISRGLLFTRFMHGVLRTSELEDNGREEILHDSLTHSTLSLHHSEHLKGDNLGDSWNI